MRYRCLRNRVSYEAQLLFLEIPPASVVVRIESFTTPARSHGTLPPQRPVQLLLTDREDLFPAPRANHDPCHRAVLESISVVQDDHGSTIMGSHHSGPWPALHLDVLVIFRTRGLSLIAHVYLHVHRVYTMCDQGGTTHNIRKTYSTNRQQLRSLIVREARKVWHSNRLCA